MAATQWIQACRLCQVNPLKFKLSFRMRKKSGFNNFELGLTEGARWASLSIFLHTSLYYAQVKQVLSQSSLKFSLVWKRENIK